MKKSEKYKYAMVAVVDSDMGATVKLEILEQLMEDKKIVEWSESKEGEKA